MQDILNESVYNDNYGINRLQMALQNRGFRIGKRRITRIRREHGWLHTPRRRPKGLTKATSEIREKENLLKQDFSASAPFTKLLTDISRIACKNGKLYISPILDCYTGEVLSLQLRDNMKKELCIDTFKIAAKRFPISGCMYHSDRGSRYTSEAFRKELKAAGVTQSLSGVNHCFDNARMESFFATLKKELLYRIPVMRMKRSEVATLIFRYIFTYYNRTRIYTSNPGGLPPEVYRRMYEDQQLLVA